jgi:hypothetical protein
LRRCIRVHANLPSGSHGIRRGAVLRAQVSGDHRFVACTSFSVPSAILRPKSSTTILSEMSMIGDIVLDDQEAHPVLLAHARMSAVIASFSGALMPAIGSSRSTRCAFCMSARANSTSFCFP